MASFIVDTSIWIDFFNGKLSSFHSQFIQEAIIENHASVTDIIKHEILVGARHAKEFKRLKTLMEVLKCYSFTTEEHEELIEFSWKLYRKGLQNKYTDLSIAFHCFKNKIPLFTQDHYFKKLVALKIIHLIL